jgi:hypothetical protein
MSMIYEGKMHLVSRSSGYICASAVFVSGVMPGFELVSNMIAVRFGWTISEQQSRGCPG